MYYFSLLLDAALKVMLRSFCGQPINSVSKIIQIFECLWGGKPQKEKIPGDSAKWGIISSDYWKISPLGRLLLPYSLKVASV
jgi:hypothetical protein